MLPNELWSEDTIFVEIGLRDDRFADSLDQAGFGNYLGVSRDSHHAERVRNARPDLAHCVTSSRRRKLVLHNNAQVLILSGRDALNAWRFRDVRHADWLVWKAGFSLLSLVTLLGCCWHMLTKRFARPQLVRFTTSDGGTHWAYAARVLRQKQCYRKALHFIPHRLGLTGFFGALEKEDVQYAVLRWFEKLPHVEPEEDVDMLVADDSLDRAIAILHSAPGIMPCDLYSETGLPLSDYCGTPYYPEDVARRVLEGAVRHNDVCMVPSQWDYFHSLCYHAVYHKGHRTNLPVGDRRVHARRKSPHDFAAILKQMADSLSLEVEISLEGLHSYLSESGWGPSPEMLARLAMACPRNPWLQVLAEQLEKSVVDQGLAVFVIRQETIDQGFDDLAVKMIEEGGFEILATHTLTPEEVEYATTRSRGGNWTCGGPFDRSGGPPAIAVVAYDHDPIPLTARQLRRFPERTNARIFIKEDIRDEIISRVPAKQGFNAMHSSDHAAEAWHLIEVLAPCLIKPTRERLEAIYRGETPAPALSRAA